MKGLAELIKTTLIGGLLVVLPIYLSILLLAKTVGGLLALLSPVTAAIPASAQFRQVIAILIVLAVCLAVGLLVRTNVGLRAKNAFERSVLEKIPGYTLVRGLAKRVSGDESESRISAGVGGVGRRALTRLHHRGVGGRPLHGARPVGADTGGRRAVHPAALSACIQWTCRSRKP